MNKRESLKEKGLNFFSSENLSEAERLSIQRKLMYDFDMSVFLACLKEKKFNILDLGCNNGDVAMKIFDNFKYKNFVGLDNSSQAIEEANKKYGRKNISFCQVDLEGDELENVIHLQMKKLNIKQFDVVNCIALLAHIKDPVKMFQRIKKFCAKNVKIFIRNIDDGFNVCCGSKEIEKGLSFLDKTKYTGYRKSAREVPSILINAGFKNIALKKCGINTLELDKEGREALFHTIFDFIRGSLQKENDRGEMREQNKKRYVWLQNNYEKIKSDFLKEDVFVNFGFLFFVAEGE